MVEKSSLPIEIKSFILNRFFTDSYPIIDRNVTSGAVYEHPTVTKIAISMYTNILPILNNSSITPEEFINALQVDIIDKSESYILNKSMQYKILIDIKYKIRRLHQQIYSNS